MQQHCNVDRNTLYYMAANMNASYSAKNKLVVCSDIGSTVCQLWTENSSSEKWLSTLRRTQNGIRAREKPWDTHRLDIKGCLEYSTRGDQVRG